MTIADAQIANILQYIEVKATDHDAAIFARSLYNIFQIPAPLRTIDSLFYILKENCNCEKYKATSYKLSSILEASVYEVKNYGKKEKQAASIISGWETYTNNSTTKSVMVEIQNKIKQSSEINFDEVLEIVDEVTLSTDLTNKQAQNEVYQMAGHIHSLVPKPHIPSCLRPVQDRITDSSESFNIKSPKDSHKITPKIWECNLIIDTLNDFAEDSSMKSIEPQIKGLVDFLTTVDEAPRAVCEIARFAASAGLPASAWTELSAAASGLVDDSKERKGLLLDALRDLARLALKTPGADVLLWAFGAGPASCDSLVAILDGGAGGEDVCSIKGDLTRLAARLRPQQKRVAVNRFPSVPQIYEMTQKEEAMFDKL